MLGLIVSWILSACALMITAKLVDGFELKDFKSAMIASVVVGFLNATIWWLFFIVTLPLNVVTFGLFTIVINAVILKMSAGLMKNFDIKNWGTALIGAIVLSLTNIILFNLL